ncbi:MAG: helix-turn-helix transcriptional regulator [Clostridia bacterium]|nr:helix-turn-helix transcriptional regulator [Clostridia bacterium]
MRINTLKELREKRGLTQEQASKIFNVTKEYLSMIERAERNPSDSIKEEMAKLYEVPIGDIFLSIKETKCFNSKQKEAH